MNQIAQVWDDIAGWWDEQIQDGDSFQRNLIFPNIKKILKIQPGNSILDIGCGNGALIRFLYQEQVKFVGADYSKTFIERANKRNLYSNVKYLQTDATKFDDLLKLNEVINNQLYDFICSTMVVHDLPYLGDFAKASNCLLKVGGKIAIATLHPIFNSIYSEPDAITKKIALSGYTKPKREIRTAKFNQPQGHHNFHRSISELLSYWLNCGFMLTDFIEPCAANTQTDFATDALWNKLAEFPPVIIFGLQKVTELVK